MQNNIKHSIIFSIILTLSMAFTFTGCTDDLMDKTVEIPDTEVEIQGEVIYRPLIPTEVQTRTTAPEGTKYKGIKSLYLFFFNSEGEKDDYSGEVSFTPAPSEGSTHERVTFKKKVRSGQYYVYAVANISDSQKNALKEVTSIEDLRKFKLIWDDNIENDLEMFGVFRQGYTEDSAVPGNEDFEADGLLTITPDGNSLHSWVRRAVSKVTVDFDGTNLKDGVTVYIKNAVLKNVASGALLGQSSKAEAAADTDETDDDAKITCIPSSYSIDYGTGESYSTWPSVTNKSVPTPSTVWNGTSIASFHDDDACALPCYENMQGEPEGASKKVQDSDGDGIIDSKDYDGVATGTYLEVEGYYVADRPEYKSEGKIIYRFMLGKDAAKNFDLVRNHHYKITMQFKEYGNDVDWHIVYNEKFLDITYPEDVNYQGKFFEPNTDYSKVPNAGHEFSEQNVITVTSYASGTPNVFIEPDNITYTYYSYNDQTGGWDIDNTTDGWLTTTSGDVIENNTKKKYTFIASMANPTITTINSLFPTTPVNGDSNNPYNLSNANGGNKVENTANCYMVGAPGWYCFPLVYGNAIKDGGFNAEAYSSAHMVNHLNKQITHPYITDNGINLQDANGNKLSNISVKLIWQDAQNLIGRTTDNKPQIFYDPNLFKEHGGGIKFHIGTIQEGNAVIALIDNNATSDEYVVGTNTKAIWSWHIWATRFGFEKDFEKDIQITNHKGQAFDVMPVNLGWCSGGSPIRYYKRRKCDIKFKFGDQEIIRTIEQYPHFAVPRGDHPFYQWGRKDPFVGSNTAWGNKERWDHDGNKYGTGSGYNPPELYNRPDFATDDKRKDTQDCLHVLIKNPDKFHNAPRQGIAFDDKGYPIDFKSINKAPNDLWSIGGHKTVYDPCPPGYQVGDGDIFTGFTSTGDNTSESKNWYDVLEGNMLADYYTISTVNSEVLELYSDTRKIQSITFPVSGYRDYDKEAGVYKFTLEGFCWTKEAFDLTNSYYLHFNRTALESAEKWEKRSGSLLPRDKFFNTDGCAVRPVSTKQPKQQP